MGMKSRLFASAAFPLLSLSLALQPAAAMAAVRDVATQASPVRQAEQGSSRWRKMRQPRWRRMRLPKRSY